MKMLSNSILISGNLEGIRAILRSVEHRSHRLGAEERRKLDPEIQAIHSALDRATHSLLERLGAAKPWDENPEEI